MSEGGGRVCGMSEGDEGGVDRRVEWDEGLGKEEGRVGG